MENTPAKQPTAKAVAVGSFKKTLENNFYQQQLRQTLKNNAGTFCTSLMELVTGDDKLLQCKPNALMAEAVKAASLHLPLNKQLGYAYLLPFNQKNKETGEKEMTPTLVIGYKGFIQLAIRSGQYKSINSGFVYEGEYQGNDKLSGMIDLNGARTSNNVSGYFAYFQLNNGFTKMLFMSLSEMAHYCKTYSPSMKFSKLSEEQLCQLANFQAEHGPKQGVGWENDFNAMAVKTVLRRLLNKWGYLSVEMTTAMEADEETVTAEEERNDAQAKPKQVIDVTANEPAQPAANEPSIGTLE